MMNLGHNYNGTLATFRKNVITRRCLARSRNSLEINRADMSFGSDRDATIICVYFNNNRQLTSFTSPDQIIDQKTFKEIRLLIAQNYDLNSPVSEIQVQKTHNTNYQVSIYT